MNGIVGYLKNPYKTFLKLRPNINVDRKAKELKLINGEFISDIE